MYCKQLLYQFCVVNHFTLSFYCSVLSIQDRVIINRLDSICHAILKGKWPSSSQYESHSTLANTCVPNSAHQRPAFMPARVQPAQNLNFNMPTPVSRMPKVNHFEDPHAFSSIPLAFSNYQYPIRLFQLSLFPLWLYNFLCLTCILGEVDSPSILARPQATRNKTTVRI